MIKSNLACDPVRGWSFRFNRSEDNVFVSSKNQTPPIKALQSVLSGTANIISLSFVLILSRLQILSIHLAIIGASINNLVHFADWQVPFKIVSRCFHLQRISHTTWYQIYFWWWACDPSHWTVYFGWCWSYTSVVSMWLTLSRQISTFYTSGRHVKIP